KALPMSVKDVDQPCAALVMDLKERGLLDDTLVLWAGEFGRTVYGQFGPLGEGDTTSNYGRDHHTRSFTFWMAVAGLKPENSYSGTDAFGYNITKNPVPTPDLQATLLHCLGIDHTRLTFRHQGRDFRLTDVDGRVVNDILV